MNIRIPKYLLVLFIVPALLLPLLTSAAPTDHSVRQEKIIGHWNQQRRNNAIPRDLFLNENKQAVMRDGRGGFKAYGFNNPIQRARPSGNNDTVPPVITMMSPAEGSNIGASTTFSAHVTDDQSGIRSVSFVIKYPAGNTEAFNAATSGNDIWSVNLQGFTDGQWSWWVVAKDGAKKGGNTMTSAELNFTVTTASEPPTEPPTEPPSEGVVSNAEYTQGGKIQTATGRIYFEMPGNNKRKGPWDGFVCSGTVVTDTVSDRAVILTAAHCAYDDAHKSFARNVLFIPNQAGTTGTATDSDCSNDPLGCWTPSFAIVDINWTTSIFPNNIPWDYAFYVVTETGAHSGAGSEVLENAASTMNISFDPPYYDDGTNASDSEDFTHALGYSYSDDPNFMYCAEDMTTEGEHNWWLSQCDLSGGSSGGPWLQPMIDGDGPVISVNSWGYTTGSGMAGPFLHNSSAFCLYNMANSTDFSSISSVEGDEGIIQNCQ